MKNAKTNQLSASISEKVVPLFQKKKIWIEIHLWPTLLVKVKKLKQRNCHWNCWLSMSNVPNKTIKPHSTRWKYYMINPFFRNQKPHNPNFGPPTLTWLMFVKESWYGYNRKSAYLSTYPGPTLSCCRKLWPFGFLEAIDCLFFSKKPLKDWQNTL